MVSVEGSSAWTDVFSIRFKMKGNEPQPTMFESAEPEAQQGPIPDPPNNSPTVCTHALLLLLFGMVEMMAGMAGLTGAFESRSRWRC